MGNGDNNHIRLHRAVSGDEALGASHTYTAAGGPDITAVSGSYAQSGTVTPVAGDIFTLGGQLVGNNRGSDAMGVRVCFGNGCNHGQIDYNLRSTLVEGRLCG
jgi:hypothetical protein